MAQIFISYSRIDRQSIDQFIPIIRRVYGNDSLWYDDDIHGGTDWWQMILNEINGCDLFIYLLSNDSIQSAYCQAELREALRLHKQILPIVIRPRTDINLFPDDLRALINRTQWIDFTKGTRDTNAISIIFASINRLLQAVPERPLPPKEPDPIAEPVVKDKSESPTKKPRSDGNRLLGMGVVAVALILVAAFVIFSLVNSDGENGNNPTDEPTEISAATEEATEEATPENTPTETETQTPSHTPTATETPTATLDIVFQIQTELAMTELAVTQAVAQTLTASAVYASATAAQWTYTPSNTPTHTLTPTSTETPIPTLDYTKVYQETATSFVQTLTATSWTETPTPTNTPTDTPTPTPTNTPVPAGYPGGERITANEQWEPVTQTFDGVEMVLVPIGCFMMGREDGNSDEKPVHEQCFEEPFWIDKTEVTNEHYGSSGQWVENNRPRETISWVAAKEYCESRNGRLPSEREWEYASRGPNNLDYPWGDVFLANNVVYSGNSSNKTADVGSHPTGISWVGALDMSGNVWEWTRSSYQQYPYFEGKDQNDTDSGHIFRGGSFHGSISSLHSAARNINDPNYVSISLGFRCARDYEPE
jgi:formylglycine-generating enzyme required for sulfatase activity